jgi:hypothetical protein
MNPPLVSCLIIFDTKRKNVRKPIMPHTIAPSRFIRFPGPSSIAETQKILINILFGFQPTKNFIYPLHRFTHIPEVTRMDPKTTISELKKAIASLDKILKYLQPKRAEGKNNIIYINLSEARTRTFSQLADIASRNMVTGLDKNILTNIAKDLEGYPRFDPKFPRNSDIAKVAARIWEVAKPGT